MAQISISAADISANPIIGTPLTRNITDNKRFLNAIYYCRSMYKEYFAANHVSIGTLHGEIQGSKHRASKRVLKSFCVK